MTARFTEAPCSHPPHPAATAVQLLQLLQNQRRSLLRRHILQLPDLDGPRRQPQHNPDHQRDERSRSQHARRARYEEQRQEPDGENTPSQREVFVELVRCNRLGHPGDLPNARNLPCTEARIEICHRDTSTRHIDDPCQGCTPKPWGQQAHTAYTKRIALRGARSLPLSSPNRLETRLARPRGNNTQLAAVKNPLSPVRTPALTATTMSIKPGGPITSLIAAAGGTPTGKRVQAPGTRRRNRSTSTRR